MIAFFTFVCRTALLKSDIFEVGQCFRRFITIPKITVLGINHSPCAEMALSVANSDFDRVFIRSLHLGLFLYDCPHND